MAAGMAKLAGADVIAVTDHNSAATCPQHRPRARHTACAFCRALKVNTAEEIHLLCYFSRVKTAFAVWRHIVRGPAGIPL